MEPSPQYAAGLLTAMERTCPVATCRAEPGAICTTPITIRPRHGSDGEPQPIILTRPHFNRVLPDWQDSTP